MLEKRHTWDRTKKQKEIKNNKTKIGRKSEER